MSIKDRGFASMTPERQRELARKGGVMAHQHGTGYEWTTDEAREAGRKGGIATALKKRKQAGVGSPAPILDPISDPAAPLELR